MKTRNLISLLLLASALVFSCQKESILPTEPNPFNAQSNSNLSLAKLASDISVFGPEVFERSTGVPQTEVREFSSDHPEAGHTLIVINGDENNENRVTSATIHLNGVKVVTPNQFNQNVPKIDLLVNVEDENVLEVKLAGKPGSMITINIIRKPWFKIILGDDFENISVGDYPDENGWRNLFSGVTSYVTDEISHSGDKCFKLVGRPYWARSEVLSIPNLAGIKYEANVYIPSPANSWPHVGLYKMGWSTWGWMFPTIRFDRVIWKIFAYGVPDPAYNRVEIADWSPDQWYHVEVIVDFYLKKMDTYINGILVSEELVINDYSDYNHFQFATGGYSDAGNSILYVDDVIIYSFE